MSEGNGIVKLKVLGRPSTFSKETGDTICLRLSEGETLTRITRGEGMPAITTIFNWLEAFPEFYKQYARARNYFYSRMGDDVVDQSDDARNDWNEDEDGNKIVNHEAIQRSRLRVDTRKWLLSKMLPKLYGDKVAVEHTGKDGGPIETQTTIVSPEREAEILRQLNQRMPALDNGTAVPRNGNGNGTH